LPYISKRRKKYQHCPFINKDLTLKESYNFGLLHCKDFDRSRLPPVDRAAPRIILRLYKSCTAVTLDNKETGMEWGVMLKVKSL